MAKTKLIQSVHHSLPYIPRAVKVLKRRPEAIQDIQDSEQQKKLKLDPCSKSTKNGIKSLPRQSV